LSQTASSGDFYGQQTATFMTEDGAIAVEVALLVRSPGEMESVSASYNTIGTIAINTQGQKHNIPVVGGTGC